MTPDRLLFDLASRGIKVTADGAGALVVEALPGILTDEDRETLKARKPEVLSILKAREPRPFAGIEATSLYKLDRTLVVDVPGLGGPLYITRSCGEAEDLRAKVPKPSVTMCVCRVLDLLLAGATKAEAKAILEAAILFDGSITGVRVQ